MGLMPQCCRAVLPHTQGADRPRPRLRDPRRPPRRRPSLHRPLQRPMADREKRPPQPTRTTPPTRACGHAHGRVTQPSVQGTGSGSRDASTDQEIRALAGAWHACGERASVGVGLDGLFGVNGGWACEGGVASPRAGPGGAALWRRRTRRGLAPVRGWRPRGRCRRETEARPKAPSTATVRRRNGKAHDREAVAFTVLGSGRWPASAAPGDEASAQRRWAEERRGFGLHVAATTSEAAWSVRQQRVCESSWKPSSPS